MQLSPVTVSPHNNLLQQLFSNARIVSRDRASTSPVTSMSLGASNSAITSPIARTLAFIICTGMR